MDNYYDIFIGNLPASVTREQLQNQFSQVDNIKKIWINESFDKITYAFISFYNLIAAEEACNRFNETELDSFKITVRVSEKTKVKLFCCKPKSEAEPTNNDGSILLELKKRENISKSHRLKVLLLKDLRQNREIINDFIDAWTEIGHTPFSTDFNIVRTDPVPPSVTDLESTIVRYFKSTDQKKPLQVDFDLSQGKTLTNDQFDKFFNIRFTKPRPLKPEPKKRKIPIAFDYRSVVDHN